jgi:hypothetical protein
MMPKNWQNQTNGRSCRKTRIFRRYCLPPYHRHQCLVSLHCSYIRLRVLKNSNTSVFMWWFLSTYGTSSYWWKQWRKTCQHK